MPETSLLPPPYEISVELDNGDKLPYDLSKVLMMHHHRAARATQFNIPPGICPQKALQERESRINKQIDARMKDLATLSMPDEYRVKAEIELRALRLSNFQAQIRNEVMHALKRDTTLITALSPFAYRRTKRQSLREARVTENLERHRKIEAEKKRRQEAADRLQHIMEHARRFREFHRSNANTLDKTKKAIVTYFLNSEREKKKEEERKERERMQKLREEDEEGYRKLLDETKARSFRRYEE
ncbi:hypothetical protein PRIPAC_75317 [Pristionchus pacificus]|uniref:HSA domain-containing protein n=1 Tax=Pristionchus pacificus TaxID=54126 RepID=A0A2A6C5U7_PRIPA|nr:hypothetical protein PRIPAC_75317 [Pristionchus pacificus]|eukprot:PDM73477.1 hypothetical protein PRIPAC_40833 [Pristionchus pacificus]